MRYKLIKLGAAILIVVGLTGLQAQEGLVATGGIATGNGSVNYSIGQITYHSFGSTSGSSSEGVQQPFEISVSVDEVKGTNILISVYPNPASDHLILIISEYDLSDLSYQMYDLQGKLFQSKEIIGPRTSIAISDLTPSTYFIKVLQNSKAVKSFKIIKK